MTLPDPLNEFVTKLRAIVETIADQRKAEKEAKAALPTAALPTAAAGGALPTTAGEGALPVAAAPDEPQLFTQDKEKAALFEKFNMDTSFRASVMESLKALSESSGSAIQVDEFCEKHGCMPLRILFEAALKLQDDDEKMLSAQLMQQILHGFTTEADAYKPGPSGALPSAAPGQSAALPSAAAIKEGDTVIGRAFKFKEKFDEKRCKVIAVQAQHYKVEILEGPAKGNTHKYLHRLVTGVKKDGDGALLQAAPAGEVDAQNVAAATELPDTLPATIDDASDSLRLVFQEESQDCD